MAFNSFAMRIMISCSVSLQSNNRRLIGNIDQFIGKVNEILFVVYTERVRIEESGTKTDVTRLISARMATEFERGLYYGKNE